MKVTAIFGGPGTGKTTKLAELFCDAIKKYGVDQVAFVSYTKSQVGRDRTAARKMAKVKAKKLKKFKTLHSLSKQVYEEETEVFDEDHIDRMSVYLGKDMGAVMRGIDYMRNIESDNDAVGANKAGMRADEFQKYRYFYEQVKGGLSNPAKKTVDFSDMIYDAVDRRYKVDVKIAFVDECLSPNTFVRMADGSVKEIQNIKIGEYVMGTKGPTKVVRVCAGVDHMFDIVHGQKSALFRCNSAHLMQRKSKTKEGYVWDNCENIKKGMFVNTKEIEGEEKDLWISPYFFGLWLGNGFSRETVVVCNENDLETINWLRDYGELLGDKVTLRKRTGIVQIEYGLHNKYPNGKCNIRTRLEHYGFLLSKATSNYSRKYKEKTIPYEFFFTSKKQRLELLAGIIDSDGMYVKAGKGMKYRIEMAREPLMRDIYKLVCSLGFMPSWYKTTHITNGIKRTYYRIDFFGTSDIPCKLPRKQCSFNFNNKVTCHKEYAGIGPYVGITVDADDELFLLANGCVVHNCQDLSPLQWKAVYTFFRDVDELVVAGDPNQSLYRFSGGASNYMLYMRTDETIILDKSYRCPENIMLMAERVWAKIKDKAALPSPCGEGGFAVFYPDFNIRESFLGPLRNCAQKGKKVLVLANTYYQLKNMKDRLFGDRNYPHSFRSGKCKYRYKGPANPIVFSTVHQAKGLEADYVLYDAAGGQTGEHTDFGHQTERWDDYWRMAYTAITRARKGLIICELSRPRAGEPTCLDLLYYAKYGFDEYRKWLYLKPFGQGNKR